MIKNIQIIDSNGQSKTIEAEEIDIILDNDTTVKQYINEYGFQVAINMPGKGNEAVIISDKN